MDIGFYLLDVEANNPRTSKIIKTIDAMCERLPYANIVLFNNQYNEIYKDNKFYILHIQQAKYFTGLLFVFDTKSALVTQTFPAPKKQILYMNEPEWSKDTSLPYSLWNNMYVKNNFEIITDKKETYDLFEICWKKPLGLISEINAEELHNVISKI
jgi:hypothetical protein